MKNIVLIGDSICFGANECIPPSPGYGTYVRERLKDQATVYIPHENSCFTQYTLRYLHEWAKVMPKEEIDVVHWNNGLWDVLRLFDDEPFTEINYYGETLKRIFARIRFLFPNAKVVFALSTSVKEQWAHKDFLRYNKEIELYNQKAMEVLFPLGVSFNDLYTLTKTFDDSLRSDWVHYGVEGSKILADRVIEKCFEALSEKISKNKAQPFSANLK